MALSIDAIHKPLNDFFLQKFHTDEASVVQFRFDQFGSVVSDEDFVDPSHPELGYSPALARERFSDLVNHVPIEQADGLHVFLSQNAIDTTYFFRLVSPSIPVIPADANDTVRDGIVGAFSTVKKDALDRWEHTTLESSTGLMIQFKPALATPETWYDKNNTAIWTTQSFHIADAAPPPPTRPGLWKLRLAEPQFQAILQAADLGAPAAAAAPAAVQPVAAPFARHAMVAARIAPIAGVGTASTAAVAMPLRAAAVGRMEPAFASPARLAMHDGVTRRFATLGVDKRILAASVLATAQPTQPAATNSITISFDYCVVTIKRPWFSDALMNDSSWCVPATAKGALTAPDEAGATLAWLPVAAVAIKNLTIAANWAASDVAAAKDATDFGPFKVGGDIVNNTLTHSGVQIVGWLVQRMPPLPPNQA
jgi:hypothetical protein